MKLLVLVFCFYIVSFEKNVFGSRHQIVNNERFVGNKLFNQYTALPNIDNKRITRQTDHKNDIFIEKLSIIALKDMNSHSNYGHKLIRVEEIGNVSHTKVQNELRVTACRYIDLNQKNEIERHPEKNVTSKDFFECDVCRVKMNKTENNTYTTVEMACVLHDSRNYNYKSKSSPPGGYTSIDVDQEEIKQLAIFSLDSITQQTMSKRSLGLIRVVSAKSQVVAGINYKMNLLVCEKDSTKVENVLMDFKNCRSCDVTIWEQSWLNKKNVTKVACSEPSTLASFESVTVTKRDIHENINFGSRINLDSNDQKVQDIAAYALKSFDQQEGSKKLYMSSKIINASKQIVAGIKYNIELEICENFLSKIDEKKCRICNVNVWEQPWNNNKNTSTINCNESYNTNIDVSNSEKFPTKIIHADERSQLKADFEAFINTHNKIFSSSEEKNKRFRIFAANMKRVKLLQNNEQGSAIYGATFFADLTKNEFKKKYLGLNPSLMNKKTLPMAEIPHDISIPDQFDWREHNAVTPVKNQGGCGSCWAFSAIANIEGQYALKSGKLLSLSEQELIDCDKMDNGCGGGLMTQAFEAVEKLGGLETEYDYPYEGHTDQNGCQLKKDDLKVTISKALNVSSDEDDIAKYLVKHGPLSIGVNANAMQFYMGGVSHPIHALCSPNSLDHGVAIVGFGVHRTKYTHKNLPYWLIKNSWGPRWGQEGYYLLYRGDGSCGVNKMVSSAVIE